MKSKNIYLGAIPFVLLQLVLVLVAVAQAGGTVRHHAGQFDPCARPGLAWLIVPRLVVRAGNRGLYTFPTADAGVLAAFARLAIHPAQPGGGH